MAGPRRSNVYNIMTATPQVSNTIPLGQITLGDEVGKGGFGVVYKARLHGIDKSFALKLLHPHPFQQNPTAARMRFYQEAQILFELKHEHIISINTVGEHNDQPYILMEYFEGYNLYQARDKATPTPRQILPYFMRITSALKFAHDKKVVHRDIRPANLMTKSNDARILDFGISKIMDPDAESITRTGEECVGGSFAAPELIENPKLLDPRCDIYSVGACWYWLLTGSAPKGLDWESKLRKIDGVTKGYEAVVFKSLDQLDRRYQSAEEFHNDIKKLLNGSTTSAVIEGISDEEALVIGVIAKRFFNSGDESNTYQLEQELGPEMDDFDRVMCLRKLESRELIDTALDADMNGNSYKRYTLTVKGSNWVDEHQARIRSLLPRLQRPRASQTTDDLPF